MDNDYSLFEEKIEMKKENNISKDLKKENTTKIFIVILIVILALIVFYNSIKNNTTEIQSLDNKDLIVLINKLNNTKSSRKLNRFTSIFDIHTLYNLYDDYIGKPLNITNKIKEFLNLNLTSDIFDLDNYNKIKDFLDIDGDLIESIEDGIFVLSLIKGTEDLTIIFEKDFFKQLFKILKIIPFRFAEFIFLVGLFYFGKKLDYTEIMNYAYYFYNSYSNVEENSTSLNNTNLNNINTTY